MTHTQSLLNERTRPPPRSKPRQPRELDNLIEKMDTYHQGTDVTGVVALKRDGWFVQIDIASDNVVSYSSMEGNAITPNTRMLDAPLMREKMPGALRGAHVTLHGELYVLMDESKPNLDGGFDLVHTALGKNGGALTGRLYIDVFGVHSISYISGARIRRYCRQLELVEHLLAGQADRIQVIPHVRFTMRDSKLSGYDSQGKRAFFGTTPDPTDVQTGIDFRQLYDGLRRYAASLKVEGFVITIDPVDTKGNLCHPTYVKAGDMHRLQTQIKCKDMYEGVLYLVPDGIVYDANGQYAGKATVLHSEKGFLDDLQSCQPSQIGAMRDPGFKALITGTWITCTDQKYVLTGIKYLWKKNIISDPSTPCDTLQAISARMPHWVSVQEQKRKYTERHNPPSAAPAASGAAPVAPHWFPGRPTPPKHAPTPPKHARPNVYHATFPAVAPETAQGAGGAAAPTGRPPGAPEAPASAERVSPHSGAPAGAESEPRRPEAPRHFLLLKGFIDLPSETGPFHVGRWVRFVMKRLEKQAVDLSELSRLNLTRGDTPHQPFYQLLELFGIGHEWETEIRAMMDEMIERLCDIDTSLTMPEQRAEAYQAAADDYALRLRARYNHYIARCHTTFAQEGRLPFGLHALIGQLESMHVRTARLERACFP